ncbi:antitoxin MazE-like protein [Methylobacterium sp. Gmos1]
MSQSKPSRPLRRADPGPGQRRIEILVPDVRAPAFRHEAQRQAAAVAASRQARDDQDFIDAVSADPEH